MTSYEANLDGILERVRGLSGLDRTIGVTVHGLTWEDYDAFPGEIKRAEKLEGERQTIWKELVISPQTGATSTLARGALSITVFEPREPRGEYSQAGPE